MSWEAEYSRKLQTAYDALRYVESGMRVYIQPGCAEPETLVEALIQRAPFVRNVEIVHMMTMGCAPYVAPDMAGHFRHNAVFIGSNVREAINDGRADYTPIYLSEIEELFERQFPPSGTGRGAVEESSLPHSQNEMSQLRPTDTSFPKHALPSGKLPLARPRRPLPKCAEDTPENNSICLSPSLPNIRPTVGSR